LIKKRCVYDHSTINTEVVVAVMVW